MKPVPHPALLSASVGILALALSVAGAFQESGKFFQSYLFSYLFWSDLPLGALPMLMIYHLTGGAWGAATRRILEALCDTVAYLAVFFIPVLIGLNQIYPWMNPRIASEPRVFHKRLYLNPETFVARTGFYFLCWLALNRFLQLWSPGREKGASAETPAKLRSLSAVGLVLFGLTATFASVDWQMSVEPQWYSTVYGMVYVTGQTLGAFAFALIAFGVAAGREGHMRRFPQKTLRDLGNILLAWIMVWAYLSFMQYLIVWSGNLPHEVLWFNHRTQGGWQWPGLALLLFQFSAPFILLLFRASKDNPRRLAWLGALVFTARIVDHYWMLMPGLTPRHFELPWETITTWLGIGGIWLALFLKKLSQRPLFAEHDPDWPILPSDSKAPAHG